MGGVTVIVTVAALSFFAASLRSPLLVDVVPLEDGSSQVTRHLHRDALGHARAHRVALPASLEELRGRGARTALVGGILDFYPTSNRRSGKFVDRGETMKVIKFLGAAQVLVSWLIGVAEAAPPLPGTSLDTCQKAVRAATASFVKNEMAAISACLQGMATKVQQGGIGAGAARAAAGVCITQFRKLEDSRGLGKSLPERLLAAVTKKCSVGQMGVTHTLADILGTGAGTVPLLVEDISAECVHYGGDGAIDSVAEWVDCLEAASRCGVAASIATQYPRALEWIALLGIAMLDVTPPATDPTKVTDALAGLDAVRVEIDGIPISDGIASVHCGGIPSPSTGQTTCSDAAGTVIPCAGTGQDGDVQPGNPLRYLDNGDGTITDHNSGLMWEKKSDDGSIHDQDTAYTWDDAFAVHVAGLNTGDFAGHSDWRLPSIKELQTIVNFENAFPALSPAFNTGCTPGCTVLTCSCNESSAFFDSHHWSSTSDTNPVSAWAVGFDGGNTFTILKSNSYYVRAVRGGS